VKSAAGSGETVNNFFLSQKRKRNDVAHANAGVQDDFEQENHMMTPPQKKKFQAPQKRDDKHDVNFDLIILESPKPKSHIELRNGPRLGAKPLGKLCVPHPFKFQPMRNSSTTTDLHCVKFQFCTLTEEQVRETKTCLSTFVTPEWEDQSTHELKVGSWNAIPMQGCDWQNLNSAVAWITSNCLNFALYSAMAEYKGGEDIYLMPVDFYKHLSANYTTNKPHLQAADDFINQIHSPHNSTDALHILQKDILIPVATTQTGTHFIFASIVRNSPNTSTLFVFDPFGTPADRTIVKNIGEWYKHERTLADGEKLTHLNIVDEYHELPLQSNSHDCAVFVFAYSCVFMKFRRMPTKTDFTQQDCPTIRTFMAWLLLKHSRKFERKRRRYIFETSDS
jgi:hypothetical protein